MAAAIFIGLISSGAADDPSSSSADSRAQRLAASASAPEKCPSARRAVAFYRGKYKHHRARMGARLAPLPQGERRTPACSHARSVVSIWRTRAFVARHTANAIVFIRKTRKLAEERRALYEKWRCIHEHEGAWDSNTGNGYYGGLQMDYSFMQAHGWTFLKRWGTADRWPVWAQIAAAEDAYKTRGFSPWPNTSRMCGL